MVFTTGYQANLGVLSTLVGRGDHLILDADSHASIYDGSRLGHAEVIRFRHNDPEDLAKRLRRLKACRASA
jgi:8-amino-7-oxononanoate synthase